MFMSKEAMPDKKDTPKARTEFQIYMDWKSAKRYSNVIDFTEQRLLFLARRTKDSSLKTRILELLDAYKQHKIAIAWQGGEPAWTTINKG
jgi:sulfatase maturation enzyme AslB (radical SAM superfamily)